VSRKLADAVEGHLGAEASAYRSKSSLVDALIGLYVRHPEQFDDLGLYQDQGSDAKFNLRAKSSCYEVFKEMVRQKGWTITDAIKGLLLVYLTNLKES